MQGRKNANSLTTCHDRAFAYLKSFENTIPEALARWNWICTIGDKPLAIAEAEQLMNT